MKNNSSITSKTQSRRVPAKGRGYFLSAEECARLTNGFGLPIQQIIRDILGDAGREVPHRCTR